MGLGAGFASPRLGPERTWAQAAPSHPRAPAPHGSARARVRTHPYSPKPLSPKPRCASPGARAPPSARRGKGDEIGSPRVRALGWVGLGAARLQAARGWGRLECAVTRISTRERSLRGRPQTLLWLVFTYEPLEPPFSFGNDLGTLKLCTGAPYKRERGGVQGARWGEGAQVPPIREREEVCRGEVGRGCTGAPYKREREEVCRGEVGRGCTGAPYKREREEVCRGEVGRGCTGAPYKRERGGVQGRGGERVHRCPL